MPYDSVTLSTMAARLRYEFDLTEDELDNKTPFKWWQRSRMGKLADPMPNPILFAGQHLGRQRIPTWHWSKIRKWYKEWKNL